MTQSAKRPVRASAVPAWRSRSAVAATAAPPAAAKASSAVVHAMKMALTAARAMSMTEMMVVTRITCGPSDQFDAVA